MLFLPARLLVVPLLVSVSSTALTLVLRARAARTRRWSHRWSLFVALCLTVGVLIVLGVGAGVVSYDGRCHDLGSGSSWECGVGQNILLYLFLLSLVFAVPSLAITALTWVALIAVQATVRR